jgi:hypothetical protein
MSLVDGGYQQHFDERLEASSLLGVIGPHQYG